MLLPTSSITCTHYVHTQAKRKRQDEEALQAALAVSRAMSNPNTPAPGLPPAMTTPLSLQAGADRGAKAAGAGEAPSSAPVNPFFLARRARQLG